jgi:ATP-dependent DNA ligase
MTPFFADWVHEIKHDGYRIIIRRDNPTVRLYSRNAHDWTARLSAIATAARRIKAMSFTIDGESVVLGPDGLSRFEELNPREAAERQSSMPSTSASMTARICAIAHSSTARPRWRSCCATGAGILFNEHIVEDGPIAFAHACRLGAEGIVSKKVDSTYRSGRCSVWIKVRNPASDAVQRERSES